MYKIFLFNDDNYDIRWCTHHKIERENGEHIVTVDDPDKAKQICDGLNEAYKRGLRDGKNE